MSTRCWMDVDRPPSKLDSYLQQTRSSRAIDGQNCNHVFQSILLDPLTRLCAAFMAG